MKIADLLSDMERTCGIGDIRKMCSQVLEDQACLAIKPISSDGQWRESYRGAFGVYPSKDTFQQHADEVIAGVKGAMEFGRAVGFISPAEYRGFVQKAGQLLQTLEDYRDSIPGYFTSD